VSTIIHTESVHRGRSTRTALLRRRFDEEAFEAAEARRRRAARALRVEAAHAFGAIVAASVQRASARARLVVADPGA
jgi:hypothetical protein